MRAIQRTPFHVTRTDDGYLVDDARSILGLDFAKVFVVGAEVVSEPFAQLRAAFPDLLDEWAVGAHAGSSQG
jgi:hypothetical protein